MMRSLLFSLVSTFLLASFADAWWDSRRRCDSSSCSWVWNTCSRTCGGGTQSPRITRQKGPCGNCNLPSARSCNNHCCPVNCAWSWNNWGVCSVTCGGGRSTRTRYYVRGASCGGSSCQGLSTETRSCNNRCCPVNCRWGGWSNWESCSQSCAGGRQTRTRSIATQPTCGGTGCKGSRTESQSCNNHCCRIDCKWGDWKKWGVCSQSCAGGRQLRDRSIIMQPECKGRNCQGLSIESRNCNTGCCPVNCQWGRWTKFGLCSVTCGQGYQILRRQNIEKSDCGGACLGGKFDVISCNRGLCDSFGLKRDKRQSAINSEKKNEKKRI